MKKLLNFALVFLAVGCGSETEEDTLLDELNLYSKDLVESCLDTRHKELCSSRPITVKLLDPWDEKHWNSLCYTEINMTIPNSEEKLGVLISASYLKMGNRKTLMNRKIFECLVWRTSNSTLSFSEFASDLNL